MRAKTAHVMPRNGDWVVTKDGHGERSAGVYSTQKEAIEIAHEILNRKAGRIAIHGRDGSIRYTTLCHTGGGSRRAEPGYQPSPEHSSPDESRVLLSHRMPRRTTEGCAETCHL